MKVSDELFRYLATQINRILILIIIRLPNLVERLSSCIDDIFRRFKLIIIGLCVQHGSGYFAKDYDFPIF